jgi:rRNA-processing protein FCF1
MFMKILLDTNFLLLPAQFRVDLSGLREHGSLATLDACIKELEKLSKGRGIAGRQAAVALALVKSKNLRVIPGRKKDTDSALVNCAKRHGYAVATNDRKLIKKLKNNGIRIIRLRQKKYFMTE